MDWTLELQYELGWNHFGLLLSVGIRNKFNTLTFWIKLTGGSAVVPVKEAYSRNTSWGFGPSMINTSMMPLSEIQWVSTWGTSSLSLKNDISEFNMDWKTKEQWNTKAGLSFQLTTESIYVFQFIFYLIIFNEGTELAKAAFSGALDLCIQMLHWNFDYMYIVLHVRVVNRHRAISSWKGHWKKTNWSVWFIKYICYVKHHSFQTKLT